MLLALGTHFYIMHITVSVGCVSVIVHEGERHGSRDMVAWRPRAQLFAPVCTLQIKTVHPVDIRWGRRAGDLLAASQDGARRVTRYYNMEPVHLYHNTVVVLHINALCGWDLMCCKANASLVFMTAWVHLTFNGRMPMPCRLTLLSCHQYKKYLQYTRAVYISRV